MTMVNLKSLSKEGRCTIVLHHVAKHFTDAEFREMMDFPADADEAQIRDAVYELVPDAKTHLMSRAAVRDALIEINRADAKRLGLIPLF